MASSGSPSHYKLHAPPLCYAATHPVAARDPPAAHAGAQEPLRKLRDGLWQASSKNSLRQAPIYAPAHTILHAMEISAIPSCAERALTGSLLQRETDGTVFVELMDQRAHLKEQNARQGSPPSPGQGGSTHPRAVYRVIWGFPHIYRRRLGLHPSEELD